MAALCWGAGNFTQKETLTARNEGHDLRLETLPGFSRCFLPITELFPAGKSTYLLIHSKRRSATSFVLEWRPVQTALQPSLRTQRFAVCSKFPILNCDHRWPWQKCKLMYHSVYACMPRVQNHMPRRRPINSYRRRDHATQHFSHFNVVPSHIPWV